MIARRLMSGLVAAVLFVISGATLASTEPMKTDPSSIAQYSSPTLADDQLMALDPAEADSQKGGFWWVAAIVFVAKATALVTKYCNEFNACFDDWASRSPMTCDSARYQWHGGPPGSRQAMAVRSHLISRHC
jgi:hypothetical protein